MAEPIPSNYLPQQGARQIALILLVGLLVATIDFVLMPAMLNTGDSYAWREESRSIVSRHTLAIPPVAAEVLGGEPGQYFVRNPRDGQLYSKYGILNGVMYVPPIVIHAAITGNWNHIADSDLLLALNVYNVIVSALVAMVLFNITGYYCSRTSLRFLYVLFCMYGTFLWFYQRVQMSEIFQVLFFLLAWWQMVRYFRMRKNRNLWIAWVWVAALVLTRLVYLILIPPIIFSIWIDWRSKHSTTKPNPWTALLIPPILIVLILGWVNFEKFGSPLASGYHQWRPAQHHMHLTRWPEGVYGFLFSMRWSIFVYFPVLFFALAGWRLFWRKFTAEAGALVAIFVIVLFCIGSIPTWRGDWTYGPRYMLFMLPALGFAALVWAEDLLDRKSWARGMLVIPIVVAIYSGYLQWQVNTAPFWTVPQLSEPLHFSGNIFVYRYLEAHVEGTMLADLRRNIDHLPDAELFRAMQGSFPDSTIDSYARLARKLLNEGNLYWWSSWFSADAKIAGCRA